MENYIIASAHVEHLEDGSQHAPGSEVALSAEAAKEPHNAAMIEDGRLVLVPREESKREREAREKAEAEAAAKVNDDNGGDDGTS